METLFEKNAPTVQELERVIEDFCILEDERYVDDHVDISCGEYKLSLKVAKYFMEESDRYRISNEKRCQDEIHYHERIKWLQIDVDRLEREVTRLEKDLELTRSHDDT